MFAKDNHESSRPSRGGVSPGLESTFESIAQSAPFLDSLVSSLFIGTLQTSLRDGFSAGNLLRLRFWFGPPLTDAAEQVLLQGHLLHDSSTEVRLEIRALPASSGTRFIITSQGIEHCILGSSLSVVDGRRRFTELTNHRGGVVQLVEHLVSAFDYLSIRDVEVRVVGAHQLPILDGSLAPFIKAGNELEGGRRVLPRTFLEQPLIYWSHRRSFVLCLPLPEDLRATVHSEFLHLVTSPSLPKVKGRFYSYHLLDQGKGDFIKIADVPTFIERPLVDLKREGLFSGAVPGQNLIVTAPEDCQALDNYQFVPEQLAQHKIADVRGDLALLKLKRGEDIRATFITVGTGHLDHHRAFGLLDRVLAGEQCEIRSLAQNIATALREMEQGGLMAHKDAIYVEARLEQALAAGT